MEKTKDDRIAIVGVSAILPGGENIFESWETIRQGLNQVNISDPRTLPPAFYVAITSASSSGQVASGTQLYTPSSFTGCVCVPGDLLTKLGPVVAAQH